MNVSDTTIAGADFLAPENEGAKTVTFAAGESTASLSLPTVDDNQDEPDGQIRATIVAGTGYTTPTVLHTSTLTVYDNDEIAGLDLRVFAPDFIEGAGRRSMYVTSVLLGTDGKPVKAGSDTVTTLAFAHVDTEASDITAWDTGVLVTIKAGKSRRKTTLYVTPADDAVKESPERFRLDGYIPTINSGVPLDSWTGRIVDNDHTAPTGLVLSVSPASVSEGAGPTSVTFTVSFGGGGSFGHDSRLTIYHGYDRAKANERCLRRPQSRYGDKEWACSYADYARDRKASDRVSTSRLAHKDYDFPNSRTITIPAGATSGTAAATFDPVDDDVREGEERAFFYVEHTFWGAGGRLVRLKGGTSIAIVDNDAASVPSPPVVEDPPLAIGPAVLANLSVSPVADDPTRLSVSWDAVDGAAKYSVRWKTGSGAYGDAVETTTTGYTVTGLSAGTTYTVSVSAVDGSGTLLTEATASGTTATGMVGGTSGPLSGPSGASGESSVPAALGIVIYHDPSDAAAAARYEAAVQALVSAGVGHETRNASRADVNPLAGVGNSVMPRFFLGDPTAPGWGPSQPKVNNGGLRWLKGYLAGLDGLSVADARVTEASGATLAFAVTLGKASANTVTVAYATADGTATAGADYTATSGTLTFAAGETSKTVSVAVLDDAHDEGEETLTLRLSSAAGARIADGEATGTIANTDPLQQEWLARFGRTVAGQMIEALEGRFAMAPGTASQMTIAGQRIDFAGTTPPEHDRWRETEQETRGMDMRELLLGSSFHFTAGEVSGLGAMTAWGKALTGSSSGSPAGGLSLTSETMTGVLGMDWERDKLLVGHGAVGERRVGRGRLRAIGRRLRPRGLALALHALCAPSKASERLSLWTMMGVGRG